MKASRILHGILFSILLLLLFAPISLAGVPSGYSEYYIPGDEANMWLIFDTLDDAGTNYDMHAVISVTAWSANTKVYYDHWEDGYDFDPLNPDATADQIVTLVNTGDMQTFESANIPTNPRGVGTYYDGGDRIYVAGGTVTVTRASWIEAVGVGNQSAAWEIYPIKPQLTTYILPFGENLGFTDFNRVYVLIQATADNTTFTVDLNADGTPDLLNSNRNATKSVPDGDLTTITLNRGQTFLLDRISACTSGVTCTTAPGTLNSGAIIQGSNTLQVKFVAGNPGQTYRARGFSAFPRGFWTKDYYAPLDQPTGGAANTDYYLHNPDTSAITINWEGRTTSGSFNIPAGSTVSFRTATGGSVPIDSALYFRGSDIFWGVGVGNAGGNAYEWGFSLLPSTFLYQEHYLGWAPGSIPVDIAGNPGNQDNVGVFLTVAQDNTQVYVDFNNDGTADLIDANLDGTPESSFVTLNRLQTQFFYDPTNAVGGGDMSQAHFWATGPFTMAYGENADTATASTPSLDLGYVAIPGSDFVSLVLTVNKSVSPQVVPTASGSTATFTLTVNSQKYNVDGIAVTDYLPANWAFVNDSAVITLPDLTQISGAAANPTITGSGPYTLDWPGTLLGNMAENQEIVITFTAQTTSVLASGTLSRNQVRAAGTRTFGSPSQTQTFTTTNFAYVVSGALNVTKTSGATDPVYPGDTIPYTVTVTNPAGSGVTLTNVSLFDALPAGVTYVGASGSVTCDRTWNVRDEFASAAYTNNGPNNSANWAGAWTETDPCGSGATGVAGGFVWITGGQLQFRYVWSNVRDEFTTNGSYSGNNGTANWNAAWAEANDDGTAGGGSIIVANNRAEFRQGTANRSISRTATVTGATSATINFALTDNGFDAGETMVAEYSIDGGAYVNIGTLDGGTGWTWGAGGPVPLTIALAGNNTITIRFRAPQAWDQANDQARLDNVDISFNSPANASGSMIQRTADLAGATSASLSFSYASANLEATDTLVIEASSSAGGPFTTLATFNGGTPTVAPPYDLTPYISANTTIRFRVTGNYNATNETFSIDNVDITYFVPNSTFASNNPPGLVTGLTGCSIPQGGSMTVTFNVTVDDPFPTGVTTITNTALTSSAQLPIAVSASATNTVVVPSMGSASAGGRVWLDADADGVQDIGEPGIPNVEVTLKDQFGTPVATTLTDGNGRYLFTGITPGNGYYVEITDRLPAGLSQTYPVGRSDNRTNSFNLTDGQVYTAGDLGYRASGGTATFGDLVWADADNDGFRDSGEVGIGGVTVRLYLDNNGDGVIDGGDTLVGTTTSAPDGTYLFTGAAASGTEDYLVSVTTPAGYLATGATQFRYIDVSAGSTLLLADFGFIGLTITTYNITDRVWNDTDGDGVFDAGEGGLAGVTIELLDASLNVIGTTLTAADGTFTFSGVVGGGADYTVRINDTGGVLTDYYGTTSYAVAFKREESNLTASIDRVATPPPSYGFQALRSIGDTIFNDVDGDGIRDAGENGIAGIVVSLYRDFDSDGVIDVGDTLLGTVTTDAAGQYLFSGLANAGYIVSVPTPAGYTFTGPGSDSDGSAAGIQKAATIAGGASVLTVDFGFQALTPRTVSGTVWEDLDSDGVIDGGEAGLAGVTLDILSGGTVIATVTTDAAGSYSLPGLASGTYTVRVTDTSGVLTGYNPTFEKTEGTAGPFNYEEIVDLSGGNVTDVKFGYKMPSPTRVMLSDFSAHADRGRLVIQWTTASETDTAGFYLYRLDEKTGLYRQTSRNLLPALLTSQQGGTYSLIDNGASLTRSNTYMLVEVEGRGAKNAYGPFTVAAGTGNALESPYSTGRENADIPASSDTATGSSDVSDYRRAAKAISAERKATLEAGIEAKAAADFLRKLRTGAMAKIAIKSNGLYYMDATEIAPLLGLTVDNVRQYISAGKLALSNKGNNVAYLPSGDMAGIFFYGQGIDSIYTNENIYWLYKGKGLLMENLEGAGPSPAGYGTFTETVHAEEDRIVAPVLAADPNSDYWFWDYVIAGDPSFGTGLFSMDAYGVADIPASAVMTVGLHGLTATGAANDHHVTISLNGTVIGEDIWNGAEERTINLGFSQGLLQNGTNTIEVKGLLDTGAPYSIFFVDSFDLTYTRSLEAFNNSLIFSSEGSLPLTVTGFTTQDIIVLDITNPDSPVFNMAASIEGSGGNYSVSFTPSPGSRYLAAASSAAASVPNAWADSRSRLSLRKNRADYIIITTSELAAAAQELADYRSGQGLRTMVVDLEDVMDEFNYGISSPEAIRSFLAYAHTSWKKAPKYAILAGDGTYDYKDNMGIGDNLVPTLMTTTPDIISPSDNLFGDVDGDHIPDVAIGRLPVLTAEELRAVTAKIIAFESSSANRVVILADNKDAGGDFPSDSDDIAALVPPRFSVMKIYLSGYSPDQARQLLFDEIRSGATLLNYTGHAGIDTLAGEGLLRISDVPSLQNSGKPFILAAMTCTVGNSAIPGYESLSEALVTKDSAGAAAVWAPSGLSYNYLSKILNENIFRAGFGDTGLALGDLILASFRNYHATGGPAYIMDIFNLQGDPALRLW